MANVSVIIPFEAEGTVVVGTPKSIMKDHEDLVKGTATVDVVDAAIDENSPPNVLLEEGSKEELLLEKGESKNGSTDLRCQCLRFGGVEVAQGFNLIGSGRGCLVMSNIFLATALTYLAAEEVGCVKEDDNGAMIVADNCDEKVFGLFRPASLITNIAVIWGVLAALFMPVIGACIDYTPHRWRIGAGSAAFLIMIQLVQIGVASSTWFYMAMLQALSGFLYQVQNLTAYAYLPEIARIVGEEKITKYMPTFTIVQFLSQALFLLLVIAVSLSLGFGDVQTARLSQVFNACTVSLTFFCGWRLMPPIPARHILPEGRSMLLQGFRQNFTTAKEINQHYRIGLRWFLLSVTFGDAAANAFTIVSVVFLDERLGLAGNEVGIFFFLALIGMIPGGKLAQLVASRTNPKVSWIISMVVLFVVSAVGALLLDKDNAVPFAFVWGFIIGVSLGWYYPSERTILSMIVPQGREAEVSGFFIYCTQILGWLPPLVFSLLVEADVDQGIGVICISAFFLIAIFAMSMSGPWQEILEEVKGTDSTAANIIDNDDRGRNLEVIYSKTEEASPCGTAKTLESSS
ncbi:Major facilitator superfamily [Seminavis robusta]|uniref:Major facilitator superfamily n=1 Tax=Seminavis robusta TaxID=568900 RepID=A0A9N8H8U7_9STRA|nr:Major facilitator superfamily [Seminavis robusta]|eukprot:Sro100_g051230.1 Major facilitator superfamily (573) ;mRNA; f:48094-50008